LADGDAGWLARVAGEIAAAGNIPRALELLPRITEPGQRAAVAARVADAAVQKGSAAREALPEPLRPQLDAVLRAFRHAEAGQDDAAREAIGAIGLQSPFLEWKVMLRGLLAYYANDDTRALENWTRLDPERLPAQLVAPLR